MIKNYILFQIRQISGGYPAGYVAFGRAGEGLPSLAAIEKTRRRVNALEHVIISEAHHYKERYQE